MVNNTFAKAGGERDAGLVPGAGRSSGVGNGKPLQYSCLGNLRDRGAWQVQSMGLQRVEHNLVIKQQQDLVTIGLFSMSVGLILFCK